MTEYIDLDKKIVVVDTQGRKLKTTVRHILDFNNGEYEADDVQLARHGRWRLLTNEEMRNRGPCGFLWASNSWMNYECSECGEMVHNELKGRGDSRTNYCPNCGAKMDGGET